MIGLRSGQELDRPNKNRICELSEHDDRERRVPIIFMSNIDGRSELEFQHITDERTESNDVGYLLPQDCNHCDRNLSSMADRFEIQGNPETKSEKCQASIDAILRPVVVAGDAVQEEETQLRESNAVVSPNSRAQGVDVVPDFIGIVAV